MRRRLPALALILFSPALAADPVQTPSPPKIQEQVAVQLVQVNFLATDRSGAPVLDLRREDIEVLENGRRQNVAFVESYYGGVLVPSSAAGGPPSPPSPPVVRPARGRWIVLFLDAYTSSARTRVTSLAAIQRFLQNDLTPSDHAALVLFDGKLRVLQTFTTDRALLNQAAALAEGRLMHATDDRATAIRSLLEGVETCRDVPTTSCVQRFTFEYEDARLREANDLLFSLSTLTRSLAPIPEIKMIVLFSDGFSRSPFSDGFDAVRATLGFRLAQQLTSHAGDKIERAISDFAAAAAPARVSVFTIYPGGGAGASAVTAERGGREFAGQRPEDLDVYRRSEQNYSAGLMEVARRSGGHHTQGNDVDAQLDRVWRMSGGLYTVGYYLTDVRAQARKLDVRVRSLRKGVVIESRRELPQVSGHAALPGTLSANADACGGEDGRRSAAVKLAVNRRALEFVGTSSLQASFSVYLSVFDPATERELYSDYRLLQIDRKPDQEEPSEDIDPGIEMSLRVPCRPLRVKAVVVDAQSGARGEFSAELPAGS